MPIKFNSQSIRKTMTEGAELWWRPTVNLWNRADIPNQSNNQTLKFDSTPAWTFNRDYKILDVRKQSGWENNFHKFAVSTVTAKQ